jgi:hypothetical protein
LRLRQRFTPRLKDRMNVRSTDRFALLDERSQRTSDPACDVHGHEKRRL